MWYDSFVESRLTRMNGLIKCEYYKNWSGWKLLWIDPFHNKMFHLRVDWFSPADMRINPEASHQSQTQVHWGIYHSAAAPPAGDTWYVHVASKFSSVNHMEANLWQNHLNYISNWLPTFQVYSVLNTKCWNLNTTEFTELKYWLWKPSF